MQSGEKRQLLKAAYGYRGSSTDVLSQETSPPRLCCRGRSLKLSQMSMSSQIQAPRPDVSLLYWQQRQRRAVGRECWGCSDTVTVMIMTMIFYGYGINNRWRWWLKSCRYMNYTVGGLSPNQLWSIFLCTGLVLCLCEYPGQQNLKSKVMK